MTYYISMGIGIAVSLAFVFARTSGNSVKILIFKSVSSLFYMLSAVFAVIENYPAYRYGSLIIMGGALGLVGDILLDLKGVYRKDANDYLKGGFIFFLIGHIFYSSAIIYHMRVKWYYVLLCAGIAVVVAIGNNFTGTKIMKLHFGKYRRVVFIYVVFLAMTNATAILAAIVTGQKSMLLMAIGATLFTLSDGVLSNTYFGRNFDGKPWLFANHLLYYAGQYLIASSVFFIK